MKNPPREISIQEEIIRNLEEKELYPFSVICTFAIPPGDGIVAITFYTSQDLNGFLEYIDYQSQCDKSGYIILQENNTIILSGLGLINFYTLLE